MTSDLEQRRASAGSTGRGREFLLRHGMSACGSAALLAAGVVNLLLFISGGMAAWAAVASLIAPAGILLFLSKIPRRAMEPRADAPQDRVMPDVPPAGDWRAFVDAFPDPALALDRTGMIVHGNPAIADIFPRARPGQPISSVSRSPELLAAVERTRVAERTIVELRDRVPVERRLSAIISALPPGTLAENDPAMLVCFRDLTDQEKLAQMRADFIAHASHELRTPLASLRGFVETLQGPARDDAAARERFLDIMAAQARRMTQLIDDLLSLSRIEMHVHVPPRGVVDLNEVISYVERTLEPVARSAGISLAVDALSRPARVRGDREELVQVFQNLMHNAIRYGKPGGHAWVQIKEVLPEQGRPRRLSATVADDGLGIPPEHLPRLTERFYRVNAAASRQKGGTGLGLAIVKNVIARHRGELDIASTPGAGSTFTVTLDEAPAAAN